MKANLLYKKISYLPWFLAAIICLTIFMTWHWENKSKQPMLVDLDALATVTGDRPIEPIPKTPELSAEKVKLGAKLYQDPQLSHNNTVACITCHTLDKGGTDRRVHSVGINGQAGLINAPSVFNSVLSFKQFWDGRVGNLADQIDGPVHNRLEMGSNWPEVIEKLKKSSDYSLAFKQLYPDGMNSSNIKDAIVTYERSLNTPNSRFDRFLKGDTNALTAQEQEGYRRFKADGCVSCHQGVLLGGNMFQKFGVFGDYFKDRGNITQVDYGRYNVTKKAEDRFSFKVPSLRNVELTAPYFHDGSATTPEQAVKVMMKYQLGREASEDINSIVMFLTTLTGQLEGASQ